MTMGLDTGGALVVTHDLDDPLTQAVCKLATAQGLPVLVTSKPSVPIFLAGDVFDTWYGPVFVTVEAAEHLPDRDTPHRGLRLIVGMETDTDVAALIGIRKGINALVTPETEDDVLAIRQTIRKARLHPVMQQGEN